MNKKVIGVVIIVFVAGVVIWNWNNIFAFFNSGFNQNGKAGLVTEENSSKKGIRRGKEDTSDGRNADEKSSKNPKESMKPRKRVIVDDTDYSLYDNTLYSWWFKRNDNHEQSGCQEDFDITQYDAHYTVPVSEKKMYITFDCGYENGFTPGILDILKEEEVTAAFFVTQTFIRDNVDLVKRMKEEGHLVCNHTVTHPSMPSKSVEDQQKEMLTCESYMKEATGYDMDLFFRPPKGEYSKRTLQIAKDLG